MMKKRPLISMKVKQCSTYDQLQSLASEARAPPFQKIKINPLNQVTFRQNSP